MELSYMDERNGTSLELCSIVGFGINGFETYCQLSG
jgi:hypothetical protein